MVRVITLIISGSNMNMILGHSLFYDGTSVWYFVFFSFFIRYLFYFSEYSDSCRFATGIRVSTLKLTIYVGDVW